MCCVTNCVHIVATVRIFVFIVVAPPDLEHNYNYVNMYREDFHYLHA